MLLLHLLELLWILTPCPSLSVPFFYSLFVKGHFDRCPVIQIVSKKDSYFFYNSCPIQKKSLTTGLLLNALQIILDPVQLISKCFKIIEALLELRAIIESCKKYTWTVIKTSLAFVDHNNSYVDRPVSWHGGPRTC